MASVKVTTECGVSWSTSINGTEEEVRRYFVGQWFNIGPRWIDGVEHDDHMVKVVSLVYTPRG